MFEVVLQTRIYFYLQAYDIWDMTNSAQRNKANPDFEVEGKHVDTNLISIFVVQVKQKSYCSKMQMRNSYFCTFKFLTNIQESQ